jgi:hypothetical protein
MPEKWPVLVPDVTLTDEDGNPAVGEDKQPIVMPAKKTLLRVLSHSAITGSVPAMKAANVLRRKINRAEVGVPFSVPADDWKRLADVLNDPDHLGGAGQQEIRAVNVLANLVGVVPRALPQLEDIFTGWTNAPDKEPEKPKPPEAPAA